MIPETALDLYRALQAACTMLENYARVDDCPEDRAFTFQKVREFRLAARGGLMHRGYEVYPTDCGQWAWVHPDWDGAPDAFDHRAGHAKSKAAAIAEVDAWHEEHESSEAA